MEWEIASLGRGKVRLSLFRLAEAETVHEVLGAGAAQVCVVLSGDLDIARQHGPARLVGAGESATMIGPGTFSVHARHDTLGLRGSIHAEETCAPKPPPPPPPKPPSWGQIAAGVTLGGVLFGSMMGLWARIRNTREEGTR